MKILTFFSVLAATGFTAAAVWLIAGSAGSVDDVAPYASQSSTTDTPVIVAVEEGDSPEQIGEKLQKSGAIGSSTQFRVLVSFLGYDAILRAGEYEFQRGTPALQAVYRIRGGLVSTRSVTVIEGWRVEEAADAFAAEGIDRDDFLAEAERRVNDLPVGGGQRPARGLEGFLFPATYPVKQGDTAVNVIDAMLKAFTDNVRDELIGTAPSVGLSPRDALIIASIIEREAQVPEERPLMAQVFLSRLSSGIQLQADPTVQYAVAEDPRNVEAYGYWKKELSAADLQANSPYNTYQVFGLPPGPICNPGLESVRAVLNPADTNYLYFVAKPDGSHLFAETFEQHLQNIALAQGQ